MAIIIFQKDHYSVSCYLCVIYKGLFPCILNKRIFIISHFPPSKRYPPRSLASSTYLGHYNCPADYGDRFCPNLWSRLLRFRDDLFPPFKLNLSFNHVKIKSMNKSLCFWLEELILYLHFPHNKIYEALDCFHHTTYIYHMV